MYLILRLKIAPTNKRKPLPYALALLKCLSEQLKGDLVWKGKSSIY